MRAATRPRVEPAVGRDARRRARRRAAARGRPPRATPRAGASSARSSSTSARADDGRVPAEIPADVGVRRRRRDVDLHDPRPGREEVAEPHRELVEGCPEHDRDVGLAHERHGALGAEASGHAEVELRAREDPAAERRRGGDGSGRVGEGSERLARARHPRAAAGEEERTLARRERARRGRPRRPSRTVRPERAGPAAPERAPRAPAPPRASPRRTGWRAPRARGRSARARSR